MKYIKSITSEHGVPVVVLERTYSQVAYETYGESIREEYGDMPEWRELPDDLRLAWDRAVTVVLNMRVDVDRAVAEHKDGKWSP